MFIKNYHLSLLIPIVLIMLSGCNTYVITNTPFPQTQSTSVIKSDPSPTKDISILATTISNATKMAQENNCDGYPDKSAPINAEDSPDNSWHVSFCLDSKTGFSYTKLANNNSSKIWRVPFYETYGITIKNDLFPEGIKDGRMLIMHWSKDGNYAYIRPHWCCIDGPNMRFIDVFALYRLNLDMGELEVILPSGGAISFSYDGKYLAYSITPNEVHIRNLQSNAETSIQLNNKYTNVGMFSWSPDGEKIVFVGASDDWENNIEDATSDNKNGFSLILLNFETMKTIDLIINDTRLLTPTYDNPWITSEKIHLNDRKGNSYIYDITTMQLIFLSTATP